jgi:hypothetical protein
MKLNVWEDNLSFGNRFENHVSEKIKELWYDVQAKNISFDVNPELQKIGVDELFIKKTVTVDVKVRSRNCHKYYNEDIGIEEITGITENEFRNNINPTGSPGWYYKIKKQYKTNSLLSTPIVSYCWESETKNQLEPIGYLIIFSDKLFDWYEQKRLLYSNFKPAKSINQETNSIWYTWSRYIPINCFPKGTLKKFNPKICLTDFSKQTKLIKERSMWKNE